MRVLMTAGLYVLGGALTVIENLADELGGKSVDVTIGALMFKRFPPKGSYNVSTIPMGNVLKLKKFLDGFDIVHNHHPMMNYLSLISRKPFVYHYHGAPNFGKGNLFRFSMLSSIMMTKHRFDAVIAVSESASAEFKRDFNFDNVYVIYNGVNTNRFRPGLDERYRKGKPQLLFVGNLYQHKKVEELIFALKRLVQKYPKSHLQIVGNGCMYDYLKHLVIELGLQNNVELVGYVSIDELPYYYASCDVYVTASRWELFGLPLLEAMACGKPVIASSISAHVELLSKSQIGLIYKEGDIDTLCKKIIKVYEKREKYISNAIHFAKTRDWSFVVDQIIKMYDKLL